MKSKAIEKIDKELKSYVGDRYGNAMKQYIGEILEEFCQQNEEFAQAVLYGGSFHDCMKAVARAVKNQSISDLDACKAAAEFYFPGSVVKFHMTIQMSKYEEHETSNESGVLNLRLEDFMS